MLKPFRLQRLRRLKINVTLIQNRSLIASRNNSLINFRSIKRVVVLNHSLNVSANSRLIALLACDAEIILIAYLECQEPQLNQN